MAGWPGSVGVVGLWFVEVLRRRFTTPDLPSYGLSIFKWHSNYLGYPFLAVVVGSLAFYFKEVSTATPISGWLFPVFFVLALASAALFIRWEDQKNGIRPFTKLNANRVYNALFWFAPIVYVLITGLAVLLGYREIPSVVALVVVLCLAIFAGTLLLDGTGWNPLRDEVKRSYPKWKLD
ncbi:MAG: hypothetical protein A2172_03580 [Candidatus Woykebacteria bacterium RBG_13_40_15]|uniref:Uncharacterized protein n=1 Tax=Candidatus Woykebacteria bacterium RBG_13_40_15 TaxID=1802593 RepID=A0A1G1W6I8_9BACT|nr:MAG: hypothetical protein A2172_03580 [Candidatus Woykebacteria bacterium RBG_13_40_15]